MQAPDDLDGQLAPALGARLGLPHVSVVTSVEAGDSGAIRVRQEFSGGRSAELSVTLPAVIGLQAARKAPRYAPITRVRQMMQSGGIEEVTATPASSSSGLQVRRMYAPEQTSHAEMLTGSVDDVAAKIVELLAARGLVKG